MAEILETTRVYGRVLRAQVRSQAQYRTSMLLEILGSMVVNGLDIATVFVLFSVTGALGGFNGTEVLLMTALAAAGFTVGDLVAGSSDRLREYVRSGLFDSLLVRPLSALVQLAVITFALRRVGRAAQGLVLYVVALCVADIPWTVGRVLFAVIVPISGAVFFASLFIGGATVAFWWIESGEVANAFTYGGRDFTSYPSTMYGGWFRDLFTLGLGFGFVAYFPGLVLLGKPDPLGLPTAVAWCSPLVAVIAACVAAVFWRIGVRHYRSTGS
ncbi:ABC transporter permease [Actinokineospora diospyrosa]|uniref:ABC-2 type transport system permease protein n=1 Tax=Actinokineospora diospyrosa TaxID=103728 RepID=A0ABT1I4V5_9PSEU|nr:ABC-2 family transporter protein [Actinokineospora diospyrosa]MCP2267619.1 ABC-2 type transport system permease protein [Actinokineospora diospyrosa]